MLLGIPQNIQSGLCLPHSLLVRGRPGEFECRPRAQRVSRTQNGWCKERRGQEWEGIRNLEGRR